jgi:ATP-dependent DNA helicase RecG
MTMVPETLPLSLVQSEKLVSHSDALLGMHFPEAIEDISRAKERIGFEELFALLLASQMNRIENAKLKGWHIPFDQAIVKAFVQQLPFELTGAQRIAAWDILQDFEKEIPMNRLLQGDVGSGKTVVAGLAARQAAHEGFQTALMAPTEILASQHAETLNTLLSPFGVKVGLLTGSVKGKARETLYTAIANGDVHVVVGTHALIQSTVNFHRLGFVVIDEQHRFGVNQRQALLSKSEHMPHLLAMTATPIPRSLALTVYGELDVSVLNELPKGRKPIATKIWSPNSRAQLYGLIEAQLIEGRQAYVICSLIDNNPDNELKSVEAEFKRLDQKEFKHRTIGLLHGKMKSAEKDEVMKRFASGEVDILVSTTVVEVGVDVPNATVILIEDADRFGLAQLHQLRGRVGRSVHQSYCYLMVSSSKAPSQRLKEVEKSNDGFYLAEVDLKLRGPGEIYGRAQHGELNLQVASLADTKLIARAQKAAKAFVATGTDLLQYKQLHKDVEHYQRLTTLN